QTGAAIDLTPSMHWPEPIVAEAVEDNAGPVMVTVEYHIDPKNREVFLAALEEIERERKRGGAYAWGIFQDTADDGRFLETFMVGSWLEHLRKHKRVTNADRVLENQARLVGRDKPTLTHFITADRTHNPTDESPQ